MIPKYLRKQIDTYITNKDFNPDYLKPFLHELALSKNAKSRTYVSRLSYFKTYIADTYNDRVSRNVIKTIKADDSIYEQINQENNEVRALKDNFVITNSLLNKLEALKDNTEYIPTILFCLYVSGRRTNEILLSKYKLTKIRGNKGKHMVRFAFLSKQKDKPQPADVQIHPIITPSQFYKRVEFIRKTFKTLNLTVNDIAKQLDRYLKKHIQTDLSPHKLRGIYAMVMYELSEKKQNINGFITDVLNHQCTDTSLNYSNYIMKE
jgi:integrase